MGLQIPPVGGPMRVKTGNERGRDSLSALPTLVARMDERLITNQEGAGSSPAEGVCRRLEASDSEANAKPKRATAKRTRSRSERQRSEGRSERQRSEREPERATAKRRPERATAKRRPERATAKRTRRPATPERATAKRATSIPPGRPASATARARAAGPPAPRRWGRRRERSERSRSREGGPIGALPHGGRACVQALQKGKWADGTRTR